jgi:hypothetical protein
VRAYSLRDPANPRLVSVFADGARDPEAFGSWTEKVIVRTVDTEWFQGDLAAVSSSRARVSRGSAASASTT